MAVVQIGEQAGLSGFPAEGPAGDEAGRRVALRDYVREEPEVSPLDDEDIAALTRIWAKLENASD